MEPYEKRLCAHCGEKIRGRSDKKFCDDRCRNQYHNSEKKRPVLSELARQIQRQLLKNRRILLGCIKDRRRCVVDRDRLLRQGFSFNLITRRSPRLGGGVQYGCYELVYRLRADQRVEIIRCSVPAGGVW
jgi:predicted nucleic acid-binding Zn ribbon protein